MMKETLYHADQKFSLQLLTGSYLGQTADSLECHLSWPATSGCCCTTCWARRQGCTGWGQSELHNARCNEDGTLQHELLLCSKNEGVGKLLLTCLQQHIPDLQPAKLLRLKFGDCGQDLSLAMTWLTAIILKHIWKERETGSSIWVYKVRAELEQYITLLRTTRFQ